MSFAPTFGSLGDFVTVCQLAVQLGRALGDGFGGSSTEYQELRGELDTLVQVLTRVEESRLQLEPHPELHGLCRMIRNVTDQCGSLIKDYLDRIVPKYSDSLRADASRNGFIGGAKKIGWAFNERLRRCSLQDKIRTASATLTVLIGLATQQAFRIEHASMSKRVDNVLKTQDQTEKAVTTQFTKLEALSQQQSQQLLTLDEKIEISHSQTTKTVDLTNSLLRQLVQDIQHVKYQISNPPPRAALDPTKELPIILEDALGYRLVVPIDWIDSWEGFRQLLRLRFQKIGKGQDLVKRGQFALEDAASGRDIDRRVPITISFRQGMKVDMSVMLYDEEAIKGACPKCRKPANAPDNTTVRCQQCNIHFRFHVPSLSGLDDASLPITEIDEGDIEKNTSISDFQRVRMLPKAAGLELRPGKHQSYTYVTMWYCHHCGTENSAASDPSCIGCHHPQCGACVTTSVMVRVNRRA